MLLFVVPLKLGLRPLWNNGPVTRLCDAALSAISYSLYLGNHRLGVHVPVSKYVTAEPGLLRHHMHAACSHGGVTCAHKLISPGQLYLDS